MAAKMAAKKHSKRTARKKRGFPVFYTIYWVLVLAALGAIGYGLSYLWRLCADYEASQPKYAAAPYQAIYTEGRVEDMLALSGVSIKLGEYESESDYVAYIRGLLEGKEIACKSVYSPDDSQKLYVATADGKRFSSFTLQKSAEKTPFGFDKWVFGGMEADIPAPSVTYQVKAFSSYDVLVNGIKLPESAITEQGIPTFAEGKLPESIYTPRYTVYTFQTHFGAPTVSVQTADGEPGTLIPDEGSENSWHMDFEPSDKLKKKHEETVLKAAKAYATFISEDGSRSRFLNYVAKKSNAEKYVNAYDDKWFTPHKSYYFSHEATYNYISFADNVFSVDVQMAFHMTSSNGKEARYPMAYRFYWKYSAGNKAWQIFDYEIIEYDYELHNSLSQKTE